MVNIGDSVKYVPSIEHGTERSVAGVYAWVIGKKTKQVSGKGRPVDTVAELSGQVLDKFMESIRRNPEQRKNMILVRPAMVWDAKVVNVNKDGSVDLDIHSGINPCVTLHYSSIPVVKDTDPWEGGTCFMDLSNARPTNLSVAKFTYEAVTDPVADSDNA